MPTGFGRGQCSEVRGITGLAQRHRLERAVDQLPSAGGSQKALLLVGSWEDAWFRYETATFSDVITVTSRTFPVFLKSEHDDPMTPARRSASSLSWGIVDATFAVTEKARKRVLALRADEPQPANLALWVEVVGAGASEFVYDLYFQGLEHVDPDDLVVRWRDLTVVIPDGSAATCSRAPPST